MTDTLTKEKVIDALKEVYDPEIPVNVVDLGLIYDVGLDVYKNEPNLNPGYSNLGVLIELLKMEKNY